MFSCENGGRWKYEGRLCGLFGEGAGPKRLGARGQNVPLFEIRRGCTRVDQSEKQESLSAFVRHTRFEVPVRWGVVDLLNAG